MMSKCPMPSKTIVFFQIDKKMEWKGITTCIGEKPPALSGHSQLTLEDGTTVLIFGGIGPEFKRINHVFTFDSKTHFFKKYIFDGAVSTATSPAAPVDEKKKSIFNIGGFLKTSSLEKKKMENVAPLPRERHAVQLIHYKDKDYSEEDTKDKRRNTMVLFGGIGDGKVRLNDVYFLNTGMCSMFFCDICQ